MPGGLDNADWIVLAAYLGLLVASGFWFSRRSQRTTEDYFLGSRGMPAWAVSISIVATSLSAASFIGVPQASYAGDLTYLSTNVGMVLAAIIIATTFIPAFYRARAESIYEVVGHRYGVRARQATSVMFMIGRIMASGARIYIGALPASLVLFGDLEPGHVVLAILGLGIVGTVYTLVGGVSSVIWTDVVQMAVLVGAAVLAIALIIRSIPADLGTVIDTLNTAGPDGGSKLRIIDTSLDPTVPFSLPAVIIAFTLMGLGSYGTDQDLAQRMLTCKNATRGAWAVIGGILAGIPSVALFLVVGLLLFVFYERPDIMGAAAPDTSVDDSRQVFLRYIIDEMPSGLTGIMLAGLFAAGLSSLNSAINAMSSTLVGDLYRVRRPDRSDAHYVRIGRFAVLGWGGVLTAFACACVAWQRAGAETLLEFALGVMTFAYAGLIAVFISALFTKRGNSTSAIAALVVGFLAVLLLQPWVLTPIGEATGIHLPSPAFAWRLTIGAAIAFAVCQLGSGASASRAAPNAP